MNNVGYLLKTLAQFARENCAKYEGKSEALGALMLSVGACKDADEARAQLKFDKRTYEQEEEPPYGTEEWYYWKGYKEGLEEAETKISEWLQTITFVPDYTPPEPQWKKELADYMEKFHER